MNFVATNVKGVLLMVQLMLSWLCDVVGVGAFLVPLFLNCSEVDGRHWCAAASCPGLGNIPRSIISGPKRSHTGMDQPKR